MKALEAKIVVLGAQGAGKTSLVLRHMNRSQFSQAVSPTIGASFFTSRVTVDNHRVKLQLWDTAGQERFRSMAPMYYRNANAALIVYDITSLDSFEAVAGWVSELQKNVEDKMVLCVIGNKVDLEDQRVVSRRVAQEYASSIDAYFFETSALNNTGVMEVFLEVACGLIQLEREFHPEKFTEATQSDAEGISGTDSNTTVLRNGQDETDRADDSEPRVRLSCCS